MALVTKNFSDIITFTRASTATYFDSAGVLQSAAIDAPRFDYNPATLAARGLLIEEARTNLRTYSDAITVGNGYSALIATLTTVSVATPISGVTTATLMALNVGADTGNANNGLNFGGATVSNTTQYTQSIFVKPAGTTVFRLRNNSIGGTADFVLTGNGTAPGLVSGIQAATIAPVGNGWYRCTWTFTTGTTAPGNRMDGWALKSDVADGVNGLYFTGAQFEAGAFPTSYIPTTTTALTRSADVASVNTLSPWFNSSQGTIYAEAVGVSNISGATRRFVEIGDGTSNDRFIVGYSSVISTRFLVQDGGVNQADVNVLTGVPAGSLVKMAAAYAVNDFQQASNGTLGTADTSGTLPTVTNMYLGADNLFGAASTLNGHLRRITYYPRRLSDAELQSITA